MIEKTEEVAPPVVSGEVDQVMFERTRRHVPLWAEKVTSIDQLSFTRMSGLSNACYRVQVVDKAVLKEVGEIDKLLYRKFECLIVDKQVESIIFQSMSEQNLGPKLYFQNSEYRIESFFDGRPLSIWEMRNPVFMNAYAKSICDFNFNKHARD